MFTVLLLWKVWEQSLAQEESLSLLAAFFSLVGCAIAALTCVFHLAPLVVLGGAHELSAFNVGQLQALGKLCTRLTISYLP